MWRLAWVAFLFIASMMGAQAEESGQKWALLVGVDRYEDSNISALHCAGEDARALAAALREACGFPADHVVVLSNLDGLAPTSKNVLKHLEGLKSSVRPGDTLVFFFSGHGAEKDGERFLLTADTETGSLSLLRHSALAMTDLQRALQELPCSRVLELVDACANDPFSKTKGVSQARMTAGMTKDLILTQSRPGGGDLDAAVTVFSCCVGQLSYEGYKNHGYFTWYLVDGLRGAAADGQRQVTIPSLISYLSKHVPEAVRLHESGKTQVPYAISLGTAYADWVLASNVGGSGPAPVPPQTSGVFGTEPRYVGAWRYSDGKGTDLERDIKIDGTYLDYSVKAGRRQYDRNGIYSLFRDGRFQYRVTDGSAAGAVPEGTYEWLGPDRIRLVFKDGTPMEWTRR